MNRDFVGAVGRRAFVAALAMKPGRCIKIENLLQATLVMIARLTDQVLYRMAVSLPSIAAGGL